MESFRVPSTQSAYDITDRKIGLSLIRGLSPQEPEDSADPKTYTHPHNPECNQRSQALWPARALLAIKLRYFISRPL